MIDPSRLFPHKVFPDVALRVEKLDLELLDGVRVSARANPAVSVSPLAYDLHADRELSDWSLAHLGVRALIPEPELLGLLPAGSDLSVDVAMLIAIRCPATKLRRRVFLTRDADHPGEWYGQIDIRATDAREVLEFSPVLARSTALPGDAKDEAGTALATYRGAVLAYGDPVLLRIDSPKERHGSLRVRWEVFAESDHPWRRSHPRDMFYVDVSEEQPEIVLNEGHELLKQALMKKRPRGPEAAVKGSLLAYIAHTAWVALFLASLTAARPDDDGDDVSWPADEFRRKILNRLLPFVAPERSDPIEQLRFAVELSADPVRSATLLTQLNGAVQGLIKVDELVVKALESGLEDAA